MCVLCAKRVDIVGDAVKELDRTKDEEWDMEGRMGKHPLRPACQT